ncbi:MAG: hypothetical protein D6732_03185 [Methanobacteriota archaeon]|nr:MAG: hypothetical protein D6732_03185 [Euryarchaeota archaeon]
MFDEKDSFDPSKYSVWLNWIAVALVISPIFMCIVSFLFTKVVPDWWVVVNCGLLCFGPFLAGVVIGIANS